MCEEKMVEAALSGSTINSLLPWRVSLWCRIFWNSEDPVPQDKMVVLALETYNDKLILALTRIALFQTVSEHLRTCTERRRRLKQHLTRPKGSSEKLRKERKSRRKSWLSVRMVCDILSFFCCSDRDGCRGGKIWQGKGAARRQSRLKVFVLEFWSDLFTQIRDRRGRGWGERGDQDGSAFCRIVGLFRALLWSWVERED